MNFRLLFALPSDLITPAAIMAADSELRVRLSPEVTTFRVSDFPTNTAAVISYIMADKSA
jgi:hypothetical protein